MGKRWFALCFAGCFGIALGITGMGSGVAYAKEGKKLAADGAVFDFKSHTSGHGLNMYGYVSDGGLHPVPGAIITLKPSKGKTQKFSSGEDGGYQIGGIEDKASYSVYASKPGLGNTRKVKIKVPPGEDRDYIINLQFRSKLKGK